MSGDQLRQKYLEQIALAKLYISQLDKRRLEEIRQNGFKLNRKQQYSIHTESGEKSFQLSNSILIVEDTETKQLIPVLLSHGKEKNIPGIMVDAYEVSGYKGRGSYGSVKLGLNERLEPVAVKIAQAENEITEQCSQIEIIALADFGELYSPTIYKSAQASASYPKKRILMKYADGQSLEYLITQGNLSFHQKLLIAHQIAMKLQMIHARGYIFYDLKPENIMVNIKGHKIDVKLIDYGSVRSRWYMGDLFTFTERYSAPEKLGLLNTTRDLFSLGKVFDVLFTEGELDAYSDLKDFNSLTAIQPGARLNLRIVIKKLFCFIKERLHQRELAQEYLTAFAEYDNLLLEQKRMKAKRVRFDGVYKNIAFFSFVAIMLMSFIIPVLCVNFLVLNDKAATFIAGTSMIVLSLASLIPIFIHGFYEAVVKDSLALVTTKLSELFSKDLKISIENDDILKRNYLKTAGIKLDRGNYVVAEQDYTRFLISGGATESEIREALVNRGKARLKQGKWQQAENDYSDFLLRPNINDCSKSIARFDRGLCRLELGNNEGAESDFSYILRMQGSNKDNSARVKVTLLRACARKRQDKFIETEQDYTDLLNYFKKDPEKYTGDMAKILYNRAILRTQQSKWSGAEDDFTNLLKLPLNNELQALIYFERAQVRENQHKYEDAYADYQACQAIPDSKLSSDQKVILLHKINEYSQAIATGSSSRRSISPMG